MQKNSSSGPGRTNQIQGRHILRDLVIALIFAGLGIAILSYRLPANNAVDLDMGDVVPEAIFADHQLSYVSARETELERKRARDSVSTVYTAPDPKVARQQVDRLRKIFNFLDAVRADPYGSQTQKFEWVGAVPDLTLSDSVVDRILIMPEAAWEETKSEALNILDQAMRTEIRESQVLSTRRQLPTRVALDTPDEQATVIVDLIDELIQPNTFPDEARTEAERTAKAEAVNPVTKTFEQGELIIPAGQIVGPEELEAIEALGLQQPKFSWLVDFVAPAVLLLLITILIGAYLVQYTPRLLTDEKRLLLLAFLLLIFVAAGKGMIVTPSFLAYLYPIAALSMMIVILIDVHLAFILTTILGFLGGYIAPENSQGIIAYLILSGWTGVLTVSKNQRVNSLLWASVYVGLVNVVTIFVFNVPQNSSQFADIGMLLLTGIFNGILSASLALIGLFAIGNMFGITTSIQLIELARPTHPLLRQLLLKAPGTYHHSLMVSNMSEQAAERIGANALLVRVMAYYHDVGKMQRPYFFIENQPEGINVHEKLDPQISAQIIISHVKDGLDLANKYRLPSAIKAGIAEHQGTGLVKYFYYEATEAAKAKNLHVDESDFRYPGPKPQSKETAILMLSDISETTVRALKPGSAEEIDEIVQKLVADKLSSGELNDCDLTISDLYNIRSAFVDILQGVHHPRIKYPDQVKSEEQAESKSEGDQPEAAPEKSDAKPGKKSPSPAPSPLQPLTEPQSRPANLVRRE